MTEILSPCGGADSLLSAINCGCDAVYIGSKSFSARQNAKNFDDSELKNAVDECHRNGVLVYQAINTLAFDSQLPSVADELITACEIGVDGIIVQDLGIARLAKELCPDMPLHASTQMSIHTVNGAELCRELSFCRVVASRELSLYSIKKLCDTGIEIEAFVHGALCMSVSGQCYMSALIGGRSANRGLCAQACRLPFTSVRGADNCDLSLKDMSHIKRVKELEEVGVRSLKIEGRMKRPEYVAAATNACRNALDGNEYDDGLLRAVFSRSGFTDGYLSGKPGTDMFGKREKEDVTSASEAFPKIHELYRRPYKRFTVDFKVDVKSGEPVLLTAICSDGLSATAVGDVPQRAQTREITAELFEKQLSKLGSTIYTLGKTDCDIESGLTIPISAVNELRRSVCEQLDEMRIKKYKGRFSCGGYIAEKPKRRFPREQKIRLSLSFVKQLDGLDLENIELASLPLAEVQRLDKIPPYISASLPRFDFDEQKTDKILSQLCERGLMHADITNLSHIMLCRGKPLKMHGGFGLNVTNSLSAKALSELGLSDITASFELTGGALSELRSDIPLGIIAYGKLPAMLAVNCPIKKNMPCKKCAGYIIDRTGRRFEVRCFKSYVEILNSERLYLADKLADFDTLDFLTLCFYKETADEVNSVVESYKSHMPPTGKITRGLYYRGVL